MRYLENTTTDSLGFGTSADWGVHLLGKLADGRVGYQFSAINGNGYSDPSRSKSVDFEGRINFQPVKGLTLAVGGYSGKLGNETKTNNAALHTATRTNALINWKNDSFSVGGEWFEAKNFKNVTSVATDKADGYSIWARFFATPEITVFARYDDGKPSKDLNPDRKLTYYNVGVEKKLNKVLYASLAYKYAKGEGGVTKTSAGEYSEIGAWIVYNF